ncbi:Y-family DNA polymerase [Jeotgalibaca dankookensis]|uniref:Y-family DNA polymerase n=1 Tax=Jeotgalibaca dankookensis TaxID=708126 RepID=UPI000783342D|nr:Y-family DNA polymerase [Jeotgalibaca dankookensis]
MYETELIFDYNREPSRDVLCIDCKSFYASVECVERGLDPLEAKLVVMSYPSQDTSQRGSGLILASSPQAKKAYHISNVSRARDLPFPYPEDLVIVPPQMQLYMQKNKEINAIYQTYADKDNHHVYSVDESFLDVTGSLRLFGHDTAWEMARTIQDDVYKQTGIYTVIGIGDNPLLAKLALDNAAKKTPQRIAQWRYQDVPETVWKIPEMTDFWGIGRRTAKRLNNIGIFSISDLAQANFYELKEHLGILGAQLLAHSWGIDRSFLGDTIKPCSKSIGNSQVLDRDYSDRSELEIVIREMADQIATRLRKAGAKAQVLSLGLGYSKGYIDEKGKTNSHQQLKVPPTHSSKEISHHLLTIFEEKYTNQIIRTISVNSGNLIYSRATQLDLFADPNQDEKDTKLDQIVDLVRKKYGFKALVRANSLLEGGRAIARTSLVGGHAGGMGGLEEGEENAEKNR